MACEHNALKTNLQKIKLLSYFFLFFRKKHLKLFSHLLAGLTMADKNSQKLSTIFACNFCDYLTSRKSDYKKHIKTIKHTDLQMADNDLQKTLKNSQNSQNILRPNMLCDCGKLFQHRQSMYKHKKTCHFVKSDDISKNDLIKQLVLQNQQLIFENKEFKELIIDQSNKMMELATKPQTIHNTHTNSHNKQFNLNVFLNEKCKNAMNMSDFVNSIKIMDNDFEDMGKLGYVQGISNILIKGLKDLDECVRPLHCSDIKREIIYIKNDDVWNKDENKNIIKKTISEIAHKNVKYIPIWRDANPTALDGTTKKNDEYMRIANQVMTSITPDDEAGINKIIRNVANMVVIDKEKK